MEKRIFSKEEKLKINKEASEQGVTATLEKYNVFPASYYSWKKKFETMGEEGFVHGINPRQIKRIRELEKENRLLKDIVIQKELEGKLKDELLKRNGPWRKKELINRYVFQGLKLEVSLSIAKITKHQYYYKTKKGKPGRKPSLSTVFIGTDEHTGTVLNSDVVCRIKLIHQDPDTDYGHGKMTAALQLRGNQVNHKKNVPIDEKRKFIKRKARETEQNARKTSKGFGDGH